MPRSRASGITHLRGNVVLERLDHAQWQVEGGHNADLGRRDLARSRPLQRAKPCVNQVSQASARDLFACELQCPSFPRARVSCCLSTSVASERERADIVESGGRNPPIRRSSNPPIDCYPTLPTLERSPERPFVRRPSLANRPTGRKNDRPIRHSTNRPTTAVVGAPVARATTRPIGSDPPIVSVLRRSADQLVE